MNSCSAGMVHLSGCMSRSDVSVGSSLLPIFSLQHEKMLVQLSDPVTVLTMSWAEAFLSSLGSSLAMRTS